MFEPSPLELLRAQGRMRHGLALLGPAFVAAVAYVDPGNFATNIAGGAKYGYLLLWVILAANLMAMLIQYLSAKVGVVTGRNLPELCRQHFPRRVSFGLWIQAELIAMATDLAEFVGAAIALNLLFGVPLFTSGLITAVVAFGILGLQTRGYRRFETTIAGLLGVILLGFLWEVLHVDADPGGIAGGFVPAFAGTESILLATGILGATVMPHVIYLHSALTQNRIQPWNDGERRELLRFERLDVGLAMGIAGLVNISMLVVAAALFHGVIDVDSIEEAHAGFKAELGGGAAVAFGIALLASGLSSSSVGTYAGQVVMQGFIRRSIPLLLRRLVTMAPALVVLAIGLNPTKSLVASQVVLSLRHPLRARAPGAAHPPARHHGRLRERLAHHGDRERGGRPDHRPQPVPGGQDVRGVGAAGSLSPTWHSPRTSNPSSTRSLPTGRSSRRTCGSTTRTATSRRPRCSRRSTRWGTRNTTGTGACVRRASSGTQPRPRRSGARSRCSTIKASPGSSRSREARSGRVEVEPDVGPARVGAPGVRPPPGAVAAPWRAWRCSVPICCSARSSAGRCARPATRWWRRTTRPTCRWWT